VFTKVAAGCCRLPAGSNLGEHYQILKNSQVLLMMGENIARNM